MAFQRSYSIGCILFYLNIIFFVNCFLLPPRTSGYEVIGNLTMANETGAVEEARIGDSVQFEFDLKIELDADLNDVIFVITGDSLKFPNIPSYRAVMWNLSLINETSEEHSGSSNNSSNSNSNTTTSSIITYSNIVIKECVENNDNTTDGNVTTHGGGFCYNDTENIDERMEFSDLEKAGLILNTTGLSKGNWSFSGTFNMDIDENIIQGNMVRGIISIWVVENDTLVSTKYVISDLVTIPAPGLVIDTPSSLVQPILGLFSTHVILNTTRDSLTSTIGCLTPYENGTNEVMLTLQSMKVLPFETTGIHENTTEYLEDFGYGVMTSTLGSYQNNKAVLSLNRIPRYTPEFSEMVVKSSFVVRVEDYSKLSDGDIFPVLMNIRFQDNILWVGEILVALDAPEVRKPSLKVTITQTKQCPYDGSTTATMSVLVAHDSYSTATAYNVTLNIYLPPYINMKSKTFSTPKENTITVEQDGAVINAEIARLTFSDPFTLTADLDLDLSDIQILEAPNRIVTAEALYNDRWGNQTDLLTETAYISLSIRKFCAKRITWGAPGSCLAGACSCVGTGYSPNKCVPCGEMWRCKAFVHVPHFESVTRIKSKGILCEASLKRRYGPTFASCYKELSTSRYLELSPRVAVITGQDSESGHYYGLSNNGAIYLVSKDSAMTWDAISDDVYSSDTSQPTFQWATFV